MYISLFVQTPSTTPFPVIDFASRVVSNGEDASFAKILASTSVGDTDVVREKLEDKVLFVRDLPFVNDEEVKKSRSASNDCKYRIIGFTMDQNEGIKLNRKHLYK